MTAEIEQNELIQFDFVKSLTFWVFSNSFKTYFLNFDKPVYRKKCCYIKINEKANFTLIDIFPLQRITN